LYLSTGHFRPLINGYGYLSRAYLEAARAAGELPSAASFRVLGGYGVRTVLVERALIHDTRWAGVEAKLQEWPGVRVIASTSTASAFDVSEASTAE
jgi:hypothetical protein